mmetsp:Transcript_99897/g.187956  ORF Transcript_99897/g.187956 Transcript_99897/m.187956 type:complete len:391 (+) Transcript_99897:118-1290(+)
MAVPYPNESRVEYASEAQLSWPPFQPAPTLAPSQYAVPMGAKIGYDPDPVQQRKSNTVAWFNLIVGTIMLSIMILIPVWASGRLLYDQTFVFFMGRDMPFYVIVTCVSVVVCYILVVLLLVVCGKRHEARGQVTLLSTFMAFVTLLGLLLVLFAVPLRTACDKTFQDLTMTCADGASTAQLSRYYHALLSLRQQPDCINKSSIESCDGYQESQPYTGYLKFLEGTYLCSGFCYDAGHPLLTNTSSKASLLQSKFKVEDTASLFQSKARLTKRNKLANMLHNLASEEVEIASKHVGSSEALQRKAMHKAEVKYDPVVNVDYPPTLFNTANYQASCDGQASRIIRYKALDIAENQYLAGVFLLVGAIVAGVLRLFEMCDAMTKASKFWSPTY